MTPAEEKDRALAKKALDDLTVIRVTLGAVPRGYIQLQKEGLISAKRVPDQPDKVDVRWADKS